MAKLVFSANTMVVTTIPLALTVALNCFIAIFSFSLVSVQNLDARIGLVLIGFISNQHIVNTENAMMSLINMNISKKYIALFLSLLISLGVWTQSYAQAFTGDTEMANTLASCSGIYLFSAINGDPKDKAIHIKMSDFSLQVANTATKVPFEQLAKTRNNMIDMMNKDFERVLDTKDNQKIIAWGKKVGELNNKCTNTIQNVTDRMKK